MHLQLQIAALEPHAGAVEPFQRPQDLADLFEREIRHGNPSSSTGVSGDRRSEIALSTTF
jgi:hypothetical protein